MEAVHATNVWKGFHDQIKQSLRHCQWAWWVGHIPVSFSKLISSRAAWCSHRKPYSYGQFRRRNFNDCRNLPAGWPPHINIELRAKFTSVGKARNSQGRLLCLKVPRVLDKVKILVRSPRTQGRSLKPSTMWRVGLFLWMSIPHPQEQSHPPSESRVWRWTPSGTGFTSEKRNPTPNI